MTYNLDSNHADIVKAFRDFGAMVKIVDNAKVKRREPGQLDLWVGLVNPYGQIGVWIWVEVKTATGKLRAEQLDNINDCEDKGLPVEVVRSTADVERVYHKYLEIMRKAEK